MTILPAADGDPIRAGPEGGQRNRPAPAPFQPCPTEMIMPQRPAAIAFDAFGTVFTLTPLERRLRRAGMKANLLEHWFAQTLRDGFALDAAGRFLPFQEVAGGALAGLMAVEGRGAEPAQVESVVQGFTELDAYPDAAPAFAMLCEGGLKVLILSHGALATTEALLRRSGLRELVAEVVSVEEVGHWKPRAEVYHHCATRAGLAPAQLGLVAAHGWDIQGGRAAGLVTAYVDRGLPLSPALPAADLTGPELVSLAEAILRLG
jgi:2-haloacid dehalogenase